MGRYCSIHGTFIYYDHEGCPRCQQAEAERQAALDNIANAVAFESPTPDFGDYTCPHCRYRTLRRDAARCPSCHGTVDRSFWQSIARAEFDESERRKAATAAAAERRRAEEGKAAAQAAKNERIAAEEKRKSRLRTFYMVWLPPVAWIPVAIVMAVVEHKPVLEAIGEVVGSTLLMAVPVLNWAIYLLAMTVSARTLGMRGQEIPGLARVLMAVSLLACAAIRALMFQAGGAKDRA